VGSGYAECACPSCSAGAVVVVDDDTIPNVTGFCAYCEEAECAVSGPVCMEPDEDEYPRPRPA
jgi:hypothetical protein